MGIESRTTCTSTSGSEVCAAGGADTDAGYLGYLSSARRSCEIPRTRPRTPGLKVSPRPSLSHFLPHRNATEKRFQAILLRCPVYNELSQLLSGTGALHLPPPPPAHIPSVFQLPTRPNTLDSTLDLVETFLPPLGPFPNSAFRASELTLHTERQLAVASGSGAVPRRGTGIERTPSPVAPRPLSEGWVSGATQGSETTSVRKRGKAKREREEVRPYPFPIPRAADAPSQSISSDDSFDSDTERLAPSARAALKQRKRDQYHQRALRRDEMEYERAMEVGKEKVREREREEREREREERKEEREFELRKLELGLQLAKAQGRLGV